MPPHNTLFALVMKAAILFARTTAMVTSAILIQENAHVMQAGVVTIAQLHVRSWIHTARSVISSRAARSVISSRDSTQNHCAKCANGTRATARGVELAVVMVNANASVALVAGHASMSAT